MKRPIPNRTAWIAALLALALLLLFAGGLALQQSGGADPAAPDGSHLPASVETLDSDRVSPANFEHLNVLALGMFLVSLGLLLGSGLAGCGAQRRLLELLRLPSITPLPPARPLLSALEVFRL